MIADLFSQRILPIFCLLLFTQCVAPPEERYFSASNIIADDVNKLICRKETNVGPSNSSSKKSLSITFDLNLDLLNGKQRVLGLGVLVFRNGKKLSEYNFDDDEMDQWVFRHSNQQGSGTVCYSFNLFLGDSDQAAEFDLACVSF